MRRREATKVSGSMVRPGSVCVRRARGEEEEEEEEEEESLFKADAEVGRWATSLPTSRALAT